MMIKSLNTNLEDKYEHYSHDHYVEFLCELQGCWKFQLRQWFSNKRRPSKFSCGTRSEQAVSTENEVSTMNLHMRDMSSTRK